MRKYKSISYWNKLKETSGIQIGPVLAIKTNIILINAFFAFYSENIKTVSPMRSTAQQKPLKPMISERILFSYFISDIEQE